ncbi:LuxR C-terminal-related transcriptional regulator [Streptomyces ossamyceticus]|uniref:LuxR C-terminal-related transcriptional regulator n=4 Tax=Streptomyces TaxID=1883 RepID=UPI0006E262EB|nr:LuxR C-terminal-related transcriptional regulator [Streptomyces neyagawaensis]
MADANELLPEPRRAVAEACHRLADEGLLIGTAGNVSMRDGDRIAVTATGAVLGQCTPHQVTVLGPDGGTLAGNLEPTSEQAVAVAEAHGERLCRAYALWALGLDAWIRGDNAAAEQSTRAGLEIQRGFNDPIGSAMLVGLLAWIAGSYGDHRMAARLEGAARSLWRVLGTSIGAFGPHISRFQARFEQETVAALGPTAFEKAIAEGGQYDSPACAVELALVASADAQWSASVGSCSLTRRELEVAALVAEGMSNRQIASSLDLSPRTVDRHIEHILAKLGFRSRARVAAWWVANHHPPGTLP